MSARPPPRVDVAVIGAGAAGIAALRVLRALGVPAIGLEARDRVGGRALTRRLDGHPVDCGAHWLHAARSNPLAGLARRLGRRLAPAPQEPLARIAGRPLADPETAALAAAWESAEAAILALAERDPGAPAAAAPVEGPFAELVRHLHGPGDCGVALAGIAAGDFAAAEDDADRFVAGGYGALVASLARGLPIVLACPVLSIDLAGPDLRIGTLRGDLRARRAVVTLPPPVLAGGAVRIRPGLPAATEAALAALRPARYEHVVLAWPGDPFGVGRDRALVLSGRAGTLGLLAGADGGPIHYADLAGDDVADLPAPADRIARVAAILAEAVGPREAARAVPVLATDWIADPLARGAWTVVPPGAAGARAALARPVAGRLWFAGDATSPDQWGTVGGAWREGTRAALAAARTLGGPQPRLATATPTAATAMPAIWTGERVSPNRA